MSSKRDAEEPAESDTKKLKRESTSKKVNKEPVTFKYYPPGSIFNDSGNEPHEMTGGANIHLATSFYHSRYTNENEARTDDRRRRFDRNAGAVQLYNKDGVTLYTIPGQDEHKEYNFVSYGNKEFKHHTKEEFNNKLSAYGHSERMLMKMVLDDLIRAHGDGKRPSDDYAVNSIDDYRISYEILKNLTNNASQYKQYLEEKNIIVKMWSERPSCSGVGAGGGCEDFMKSICPEGSQFGWIIADYEREDNGGPRVTGAFEELKNAYLAWVLRN